MGNLFNIFSESLYCYVFLQIKNKQTHLKKTSDLLLIEMWVREGSKEGCQKVQASSYKINKYQ